MVDYTNNWDLVKLNTDGSDLIDAESQVAHNFDIIDERGWLAKGYKVYNIPYTALPNFGNDIGNYIYNHYDSSIYVWDGSSWRRSDLSSARSSLWVDISLNSGMENITGNFKLGYKIIAQGGNTRVRLRGRVRQTGYAIFPRGSFVNIANLALPTPSRITYLTATTGGNGPRYMQLSINVSGTLSAIYMSDADMANGSTGNYVDINGVSYTVSPG